MIARLYFILIFVVLLATELSAGTAYYVSNSGNDGAGGTTIGTAWKTMWKVGTTLRAGDTIWILGGTYDENNSGFPNVNGTLKFSYSGTYSDSIFVFGHPDYARPIIYGNQGIANRWHLHLSEGNDYFKFRFLKFEYGHKAVRLAGADYITFEDCISTHNLSSSADENGGGWLVGWDAQVSRGIVWYNCEAGPARLGSTWATGRPDQNLSGWHLYKCWYSVIDSCRLTPSNDSLQAGVFFKVNNYHNIIRNNDFNDGAKYSIRWGTRSDYTASYIDNNEDSAGFHYIYNNVFRNSVHAITFIQSTVGYSHVDDTLYFFNNTIYGMSSGGFIYSSAEQCQVDSIFKEHYFFNNIWINTPTSGTGASHAVSEKNFIDANSVQFDNNVFYGSANNVGKWDGSFATNLSSWQSNSSRDANSQYLNPYLADAAGGDFTMTGSTPAFVRSGGIQIDGLGENYIGAFDPNTTYNGSNISGDTVVAIKTDEATIQWTTDSSAFSWVRYSINLGFGSSSGMTSGAATSRSVTLTGLDSSTVYNYKIYSTYGDEDTTVSAVSQFLTLDTIPPAKISFSPGSPSETSLGHLDVLKKSVRWQSAYVQPLIRPSFRASLNRP